MKRVFLSLFVAFILATFLVFLLGESPLLFLQVLATNVFRSQYDFGMYLFFATPLIFTGLAVSLPLRAGLFNIGVEGQLHMGALGCFLAGAWYPQAPYPLSIVLSMIAGILFGGMWGVIPGALRAYTGVHEVISSILLNFIAIAFTNWICLDFFQNPDSQNPETWPLSPSFLYKQYEIFAGAPVSAALLLGIACAVLLSALHKKTSWGLQLDFVGQQTEFARSYQLPVNKIMITSFFIAGILSAGVGFSEVLGNSGRFQVGFSPGYGFTGIAVALLARGNFLGTLASAFFFAYLHKTCMELEFESEKITRDFSLVLQALMISCVGAEIFFQKISQKLGKKNNDNS